MRTQPDVPPLARSQSFTLTANLILFLLFIGITVSAGQSVRATECAVIALNILVAVLVDFVAFTKTYLLLRVVAVRPTVPRLVVAFIADLLSAQFLLCVFVVSVYGFTQWLVRRYPVFLVEVFHLKIEYLQDGKPDWTWTFIDNGLGGNETFLAAILANLLTTMASVIVFGIFVLALMSMRAAQRLSIAQTFIDNHMDVETKPVQVLGLFAVIGFSIMFWIWYPITILTQGLSLESVIGGMFQWFIWELGLL